MPYASQPEILRVATCDDNPPVLEKMQEIVERTLSPFWELIVFRDTSPRNLLSQAGAFQILVLDIQLLEENGTRFQYVDYVNQRLSPLDSLSCAETGEEL